MILSRGFALLLSFTLSASLLGGEVTPSTSGKYQSEFDGYLRLASSAAERGNIEVAETFYQRLLSLEVPVAAKRPALFQMAKLYESSGALAKAIAVLEEIRELIPDDPDMAEILLRLGRLYRDSGAHQAAISRFYSVLNSALKVNEPAVGRYQDFTQQAQMEIAETYFATADYLQASKFFSLLGKLELSRDEKAYALFRAAYCSYLIDDKAKAETAARGFLADYSDTKFAPECRYLLARTLKSLGRPQEATEEVLKLLQAERAVAENDPKVWAYWQQKAGNQLANEFYLQGDMARSVVIYQALARLNTSAEWLWPVIYQMGLCFERMHLADRAKEAYAFIAEEAKKPRETKPDDAALDRIVKMAGWRSDQLVWQESTEASLQALLGNPIAVGEASITATP